MFTVSQGAMTGRWWVESTNHAGVFWSQWFHTFDEAHDAAIAWAKS